MSETITAEEREQRILAKVREASEELEAWDGESGAYYWMSFVDETEDNEGVFQGIVVLKAPSPIAAHVRTRWLKVWMPGQVLMSPLHACVYPFLEAEGQGYVNRKLSRPEAEELNELFLGIMKEYVKTHPDEAIE
jgi:hypothetical protein